MGHVSKSTSENKPQLAQTEKIKKNLSKQIGIHIGSQF